MAVFNKTIVPLALVGYEMIIANSAIYRFFTISYPTSASGVIVKYSLTYSSGGPMESFCMRYLPLVSQTMLNSKYL